MLPMNSKKAYKNLTLVILIICLLACATGCYNNSYNKLYPAANTSTCDTANISYSKDIAPIIASNCFNPGNGCHDAAGSSTSLFNYETYAGILPNIQSGDLINDINWTPLRGKNDMPKNANKLQQCDINKITRWINEGYPDN